MTTDKYSEGAMQAAKRINWQVGLAMTSGDLNLIDDPKVAAIIDEETRPEWIKCAERMPEPGEKVLIRTPDRRGFPTTVLGWLNKWDQWLALGLSIDPKPTHWLPLPPGPKEG